MEAAADPVEVSMIAEGSISDLFWGAIEATEEAILNALVAADTMVGRDGITARRLDHDDARRDHDAGTGEDRAPAEPSARQQGTCRSRTTRRLMRRSVETPLFPSSDSSRRSVGSASLRRQ